MQDEGSSRQPSTRVTVSIGACDLQEINRLQLVARVVSNAVHDINNAMQVIGGSAEMLGLQGELGPAAQRRVQTIAKQTEHVATTLDRVASFTRPAAAGQQQVDLGALAESAVALRRFTLNRARITVTVERAAGVPCVAAGDRRRLLQAFLNLLVNAEAALADRPNAMLSIRLEQSGDDCCVSFTDNGPGITAEILARLADVDVVPNVGPGLSGMGLWVAARIAEEHRGRLEAGDAPPQGASLRLRLPAGA